MPLQALFKRFVVKKRCNKHLFFVDTENMLMIFSCASILQFLFSWRVNHINEVAIRGGFLAVSFILYVTNRILKNEKHKNALVLFAFSSFLLYRVLKSAFLECAYKPAIDPLKPEQEGVLGEVFYSACFSPKVPSTTSGRIGLTTNWIVVSMFLCTGLNLKVLLCFVLLTFVGLVIGALVSQHWGFWAIDIPLYIHFTVVGLLYYYAFFCIGVEICRLRRRPLRALRDLPLPFFTDLEPRALGVLPDTVATKELSREEHLYILLRVTQAPATRGIALDLIGEDPGSAVSLSRKDRHARRFLRAALLGHYLDQCPNAALKPLVCLVAPASSVPFGLVRAKTLTGPAFFRSPTPVLTDREHEPSYYHDKELEEFVFHIPDRQRPLCGDVPWEADSDVEDGQGYRLHRAGLIRRLRESVFSTVLNPPVIASRSRAVIATTHRPSGRGPNDSAKGLEWPLDGDPRPLCAPSSPFEPTTHRCSSSNRNSESLASSLEGNDALSSRRSESQIAVAAKNRAVVPRLRLQQKNTARLTARRKNLLSSVRFPGSALRRSHGPRSRLRSDHTDTPLPPTGRFAATPKWVPTAHWAPPAVSISSSPKASCAPAGTGAECTPARTEAMAKRLPPHVRDKPRASSLSYTDRRCQTTFHELLKQRIELNDELLRCPVNSMNDPVVMQLYTGRVGLFHCATLQRFSPWLRQFVFWIRGVETIMAKAQWQHTVHTPKRGAWGRFVDTKIERWFLAWASPLQARLHIVLCPLVFVAHFANVAMTCNIFMVDAIMSSDRISPSEASSTLKRCALYLTVRCVLHLGILTWMLRFQRAKYYKGPENAHFYKRRASVIAFLGLLLSFLDTWIHQLLIPGRPATLHFVILSAVTFPIFSQLTTATHAWVAALTTVGLLTLVPVFSRGVHSTVGTVLSLFHFALSLSLWFFFISRCVVMNYRLLFCRYVLPYLLYLDALRCHSPNGANDEDDADNGDDSHPSSFSNVVAGAGVNHAPVSGAKSATALISLSPVVGKNPIPL